MNLEAFKRGDKTISGNKNLTKNEKFANSFNLEINSFN